MIKDQRFVVSISKGCLFEKRYVIRWVLEEIFGLLVEFEIRSEYGILIQDVNRNASLSLSDAFFERADKDWLVASSVPEGFLEVICGLGDSGFGALPILFFEEKAGAWSQAESQGELKLDIFGTLFFLISRYEEGVLPDRDKHNRFPSKASWMGRNGLLQRAVGNEYIEILWKAMQCVWPGLVRKPRKFRMMPSHDIDYPSSYWGKSIAGHLRFAAGALMRRAPFQAARYLWDALRYPRIDWSRDPVETLDWIMDLSEENGVKSAFYYIPEQTDMKWDLGMPLEHPQVIAQWQRIGKRGHELGLHPGYQTYNQPARIESGAERIRKQIEVLGFDQSVLGGRQHYLRWNVMETPMAWDSASLHYDSTLAFAEECGFRSGVCYEYPMYDLHQRCELKLRQRPLVLMECSLIDDKYMGLGSGDQALAAALNLKNVCQKYDGDFTILWHNQRLIKAEERQLYASILSGGF